VSPLRGEKPQNWPLSKLNTGRFALRAMLPVINPIHYRTENTQAFDGTVWQIDHWVGRTTATVWVDSSNIQSQQTIQYTLVPFNMLPLPTQSCGMACRMPTQETAVLIWQTQQKATKRNELWALGVKSNNAHGGQPHRPAMQHRTQQRRT